MAENFTTSVNYVYEANNNIALSKSLLSMLWKKLSESCAGGDLDHKKMIEVSVGDALKIIHGLELLNNQLESMPIMKDRK